MIGVVAIASNGVIGRGGEQPWDIPADRKRFDEITNGKWVLMGRKTYERLPSDRLPGRRILALTRSPERFADIPLDDENTAVYFGNWDMTALDRELGDDCIVAGGAETYKCAEPFMRHMLLTAVEGSPKGDVYLGLTDRIWRLKHHDARVTRSEDANADYDYQFQLWDNINRTTTVGRIRSFLNWT